MWMHTYNWHMTHTTSASPFSAQLFLVTQLKQSLCAHLFSPSTPVLFLPIKSEEWRQWDGAFRCGTGGVWVIFRQLCLKQWNQTEVPCRVRRLLLKVVLLLSGSAQTHFYPYSEKTHNGINSKNSCMSSYTHFSNVPYEINLCPCTRCNDVYIFVLTWIFV